MVHWSGYLHEAPGKPRAACEEHGYNTTLFRVKRWGKLTHSAPACPLGVSCEEARFICQPLFTGSWVQLERTLRSVTMLTQYVVCVSSPPRNLLRNLLFFLETPPHPKELMKAGKHNEVSSTLWGRRVLIKWAVVISNRFLFRQHTLYIFKWSQLSTNFSSLRSCLKRSRQATPTFGETYCNQLPSDGSDDHIPSQRLSDSGYINWAQSYRVISPNS